MKRLLFFFIVVAHAVSAQSYFYSVGLGANLFKGDVQTWNYRPGLLQLTTARPSIHGEFGVQLNPSFDARIRLSLGRLNGDPSKLPLPNVSSLAEKFSTTLFETALLADYNFFNFTPPKQSDFRWSPYITTGIALFMANPNQKEPITSLAIPYGLGVKWKYNKKIMFRIEGAARKTFTDRLDLWPILGPNEKPSNFTLNRTDQYLNFSFSVIYSVYPIICPRLD